MQFLFVPQIISQWIHWPIIFPKLPAVLFLDLTCMSGGSLICSATVLWGNSADWESWKPESPSIITRHNPQAIMHITAALGLKTKAFKVNKKWVSWGGDSATEILSVGGPMLHVDLSEHLKTSDKGNPFLIRFWKRVRESPSQGMLSRGNTKWHEAQPFGLIKVLQPNNCRSTLYNAFQIQTYELFLSRSHAKRLCY